MTAVLAAAVGRGYRGQHRLAQVALGACPVAEPADVQPGDVQPDVVQQPALVPLPEPAPLPELVRQPDLVTAASAHLSLVPVRHSADPLVDTVPHPVVRLFPLPVADPVLGPDATGTELAGAASAAADVLPYRSRHSA